MDRLMDRHVCDAQIHNGDGKSTVNIVRLSQAEACGGIFVVAKK